ncbi:hypothetical protein [Rhizobium herbae]
MTEQEHIGSVAVGDTPSPSDQMACKAAFSESLDGKGAMPALRAEEQLTTVGPAAAFQAKTGKETCSGANPVLVKVVPWASAPQADSRGNQSVETGFGLNHRNELSAGHGSGLSDSDLAHEGDEPSRSVELNSEVSGGDHPDAPVWHGEGNTAVSDDLVPNLGATEHCDAALADRSLAFKDAKERKE